MDSANSENEKNNKKTIHNIRRRLRKIENLELEDRDSLSEQQLKKIARKDELREILQTLLVQRNPEEADIMKRLGSEHTEEPEEKKTKKDEANDSGLADVSSTSSIEEKKSKKSEGQEDVKKPLPQTPKEPVKISISPWRDTNYKVFTLQGHQDIILDVDCADGYVLSASRDTTVRVWQVGNLEEERSLRGHRSSVTSVSFLPGELAARVMAKIEAEYEGQESAECKVLAVSGGLDCTLKVWDIISGESHGSIYTYNGITSLACGAWGVVTGTEGGKLEIWCLATGQRLAFFNAFESQVTTIDVRDDVIYAGSMDGELGVWRYDSKGRTMATLFATEPESSTQVKLRHLATLKALDDIIYLGDSGPNLKKFNWKKSSVARLKNHVGEVGMTDSLAVTSDDHIISASYYLDVGYPSINIRRAKNDEYVCSLISQGNGRYLSMCTNQGIIVTGGHELKVWVRGASGKTPRKATDIETVRPSFLRKLLSPPEESSDDDTDGMATTDDEDDEMPVGHHESFNISGNDGASSWWCTII